MKTKFMILLAALGLTAATNGRGDTTLVFDFDTTVSSDGITYSGLAQDIDFSGAYTGTDETNFHNLDGLSGVVNFSIDAVGDLSSAFSGTMTPTNGNFNIGGNGGGVEGGASNSYFDPTEAWTFTFNHDVILNAVNYYAPDTSAQIIEINGSSVSGSPFDGDFSGQSFTVLAGQTLKFTQNTASENYALQDFTLTAIPEPSSIMLMGLVGIAAVSVLRKRK